MCIRDSYHTTAEYARNYTLTIQGSLAGYNTRDDGVIVVANGDRIIASNDEELADTKVAVSYTHLICSSAALLSILLRLISL